MALPFPNVPNLPGVPQVPRLPGAVVSTGLTIGSGIITALLGAAAQKQNLWGIYVVGEQTPTIQPDSTLEFSYRQQFDVSDFPVVSGAFASYNKVQRPFEIQLRLSKGGTQHDRSLFLSTIDTMLAAITLYDIHTPEKIYSTCNLDRAEVTRTSAKDAFFLTQVDLYFIQIMQTAPQYTNTETFYPGISTYNAQSSAAVPTTNQGTVQPQTTSGNVASIGQSALGSTNSTTY